MSCYHPLTAIVNGIKDNGKKDITVISKQESLNIDHDCNIISLPCGKCVGCRLDYSRQWADRCMLEASYHECNCFITLTIDDDHLKTKKTIYHGNTSWEPIDNINVNKDGEILEKTYYSLRKSDFQKFMKRLRKQLSEKYDIKIRFFACSEYGSESFRPHYHAIIFGYDFSDDRVLYKQNFNGDCLYNSSLLSDCWPFGYAVVADCTWNTCAYVARYCLKKSDNDLTDFYNYCDCEPESIFMSRRPGIARQFYDDNRDNIYRFGCVYLPEKDGSRKIRPCRYFDKLYDIDNPENMQTIRDSRNNAIIQSINHIEESTDLNYFDYLKVKEYNHNRRIQILKERKVQNE